MRLNSLSALLGLLTVALAADITLYLPATPNPFTLPPTTHATLTSLHRRASAPLSSVNTFVFRGVPAGSYLLDVHCATDAFKPLRVDVAEDGSAAAAATHQQQKLAVQVWETYRGNDWENKGEKLEMREGSAGAGVELRAIGGKEYFMERPKFSVLQILKSPMILMGLVSMILVVGMPKLMENMDPEMKAEFEKQQKEGPMAMMSGGGSGGGGQKQENPLSNFDMAAYLAGSGKKNGGNGGSPKDQGGVRR